MHNMSLLSLCLNRCITNNFQSALKSALTKSEDTGIALQWTSDSSSESLMLARCGRISIYPLWEKMRFTGADVAGVQKCSPIWDKVCCTGSCGKLYPTANQLGQNQCNLVYIHCESKNIPLYSVFCL